MNSPGHTCCTRWSITLALYLLVLFFGFISPAAYSQVPASVASVSPTEVSANTPANVKVELRQGAQLERVFFVYRQFGESNYKKLEMDVVGNAATTSVPAKEVVPPFLEYYLVLISSSGHVETYPLSESADPLSNPPVKTMQITVSAAGTSTSPVVFLSPDPDEPLAASEVLISVSLLRAGAEIAKSFTKIFVDDAEITSGAVFSNDIIVYAPENFAVQLDPGPHTIKVRLFDQSGTLQSTASTTFTVSGQPGLLGAPAAPRYSYGASVQLESRQERVSDEATWYNRANLQFTGRADEWRLRSNLYVTSDEKSDRQPQNRFFIGAESPWLKAGYGDSYPSFPDLILSGKRVRGLNSALRLGVFNVDLALGSTTRAVEGALLRTFSNDSLAVEQQRDPAGAFARIDPLTWGKFTYGTYSRDLFAIRPSWGSGETWQLGFTWLQSKDDTGSIKHGIRPQENVVVGTDLVTKLDNGHIEFTGQGAFSAFNGDVSGGNFNDAYIDSVYKENAQDVKDTRDFLQHYITVNDYLRPLSLKKLSTLAYDMSLALDYVNHYVKLNYVYRGSDYNSFGQTFLRKDIRGFNLSDRVRLLENQILFVAGYERLQDNTSDTKTATTTYSTLNFALTYYPRLQVPNFTVGFSRYANSNGLSVVGPEQFSAINDATNRYFIQSSYNFDYGARHMASLTFSLSNRGDYTVYEYDVKNTTVTLGVNSRFRIPLQTTFEVSVNRNDFPSGNLPAVSTHFDYTTLSLSGRYSVRNETLRFLAAISPTFGDFTRTAVDLGSEWYALSSMRLSLQFSLLQNHGGTTDTIWSLRYRYDL